MAEIAGSNPAPAPSITDMSINLIIYSIGEIDETLAPLASVSGMMESTMVFDDWVETPVVVWHGHRVGTNNPIITESVAAFMLNVFGNVAAATDHDSVFPRPSSVAPIGVLR